MFDFDPRDSDAREDDRFDFERGRGSASHDNDRDDDGRQPDVRSRDHDATSLGRWSARPASRAEARLHAAAASAGLVA